MVTSYPLSLDLYRGQFAGNQKLLFGRHIRCIKRNKSLIKALQTSDSLPILASNHDNLLSKGLNEMQTDLSTYGLNGLQQMLQTKMQTSLENVNFDSPQMESILPAIQRIILKLNSTLVNLSSGIGSQSIDVDASQPHMGSRLASQSVNLLSEKLGGPSGIQNLLQDLRDAVSNLKINLPEIDLGQFHGPEMVSVNAYMISLRSMLSGFEMQLNDGSISKDLVANPLAASILSFIVITVIALSTPQIMTNSQQEKISDDMEVPLEYDPEKIAEFFRTRPVLVAKRSFDLSIELIRYGSGIIQDLMLNRFEQNHKVRAQQLRESIERLGSAYIKVAQAVSTRVDLLPEEYIIEIERLQDRVPPFPTSDAIEVLENAYGVKVDQIFSYLSAEPIAAASLGQVYKGTLRENGAEVAVKVQRPDVLESVILDLYLMRKISFWVKKYTNTNTEWWLLVDEWGGRYLQEMDYQREAANGLRFSQDVAELQGVFAPEVYPGLCSRKVLVTAWVEGERLVESQAADVLTLTNTLLTAYLIQLLETGFMHADPHPGNLIRTPDGRICVLDFGLVTEVSEEQKIALISYIAHLQLEDWEAITVDLQNLGFITSQDDVTKTGLVEPLGRIFSELIKGGGSKGVNIDYVVSELQKLSQRFPIFQVPAFFTLILRTFTVIEGIGLKADPKYAIVKECFPYLANRLLTDDSPQSRRILKEVLYGKRKTIDVNRVRRLMDGLQNFSTDALITTQETADGAPAPIIDPTLKQAIQVVFSREGSYIQSLVVNEMVTAVDALSREALSEIIRSVVVSAPATAALQALGPLRQIVFPFPTFVEVLSTISPVVELTEEDREALTTIRGLVELAGGPRNALGAVPAVFQSPEQSRQLIEEIVGMLPQLLPGLAKTGELFIRQLLSRVLTRLSESLADDDQGNDYGLSPTSFLSTLSQPQKQFLVNGMINFMKQDIKQ